MGSERTAPGDDRSGHDIVLTIVGHLGFAEDDTPFGHAVNLGGSGYACARGASAVRPERVGLMARVGEDFDMDALRRLGVDIEGVTVTPGRSPRLRITQHSDDHRSFESSLGVAVDPPTEHFPSRYLSARHFHLATMPPPQQLEWLGRIRELTDGSTISVDMFEPTAIESPEESRQLCYRSDLAFMNAQEHRLLFTDRPAPDAPMIIKRGKDGAAYISSDGVREVHAPQVHAVDTTGAGEVLAGAFLSLHLAGVSVLDALRHAVEAASAKVTEFGVDGSHLRSALERIGDSVEKRLPLP